MMGGGGGRDKKDNYLKIQTGLTSKLLFLSDDGGGRYRDQRLLPSFRQFALSAQVLSGEGSSKVHLKIYEYAKYRDIQIFIQSHLMFRNQSYMFHNISIKKSFFGMTYLIYFKASLLYLGFSFQLKENDVDDANRVCTQLSANNCQESLFSGFTNPNKLSFCTLPPTI